MLGPGSLTAVWRRGSGSAHDVEAGDRESLPPEAKAGAGVPNHGVEVGTAPWARGAEAAAGNERFRRVSR